VSESVLPELVLPLEDRDHHVGPITARYRLVGYLDFECPHCAHVHPIVKELLRELGDDLCYVFRHFPQAREHPHARSASLAAEAADMQGKFWLMHDRLFENQSDLSETVLRRLARELPLEMGRFERDRASEAATRRVDEDYAGGEENGVEETPTFFVNGQLHVGSYEFLPLLNALRAPRE
jgi:protein-disulfide isomerase